MSVNITEDFCLCGVYPLMGTFYALSLLLICLSFYQQHSIFNYSGFTVGLVGYLLPLYTSKVSWDFPGGPVVKTSLSSRGVVGLIPGWGAKIAHASWPKKQKTRNKQYFNKLNKDLKIVHIKQIYRYLNYSWLLTLSQKVQSIYIYFNCILCFCVLFPSALVRYD